MAASPVIQPGDEFVEATGYNRDYAAMLLRGCGRGRVQSSGTGTSACRTDTRVGLWSQRHKSNLRPPGLREFPRKHHVADCVRCDVPSERRARKGQAKTQNTGVH